MREAGDGEVSSWRRAAVRPTLVRCATPTTCATAMRRSSTSPGRCSSRSPPDLESRNPDQDNPICRTGASTTVVSGIFGSHPDDLGTSRAWVDPAPVVGSRGRQDRGPGRALRARQRAAVRRRWGRIGLSLGCSSGSVGRPSRRQHDSRLHGWKRGRVSPQRLPGFLRGGRGRGYLSRQGRARDPVPCQGQARVRRGRISRILLLTAPAWRVGPLSTKTVPSCPKP